ncbi:hypothetical protein, partial [Hymenobacter agri]
MEKNVMLSLSKHLYRASNSFTIAIEMLRQAQHDRSIKIVLLALLLLASAAHAQTTVPAAASSAPAAAQPVAPVQPVP